jgi:hypothetical protein
MEDRRFATHPPRCLHKTGTPTYQAADAAEAVDADVDGAGRLGVGVGGVDDVDELGLERRAAHEEAVDVGLAGQLGGVLGCCVCVCVCVCVCMVDKMS